MTKKQKNNVLKVSFAALFAFLILLAIFFNITVDAESSKLVVDMNNFAVKLVTNFTENVIFYGLIILAVIFGVRFFKRK